MLHKSSPGISGQQWGESEILPTNNNQSHNHMRFFLSPSRQHFCASCFLPCIWDMVPQKDRESKTHIGPRKIWRERAIAIFLHCFHTWTMVSRKVRVIPYTRGKWGSLFYPSPISPLQSSCMRLVMRVWLRQEMLDSASLCACWQLISWGAEDSGAPGLGDNTRWAKQEGK